MFKTNQVLRLYNPKYETLIETDSSGYGLGVVLMQRENSSSPWHPVQFLSRTLNAAEKNYPNIEREALSVIFACEKFRKFLLGSHFIIRNDHKPLDKIFKCNSGVPVNVSARLQRWALRFSQFDYEFIYSKGSQNVQSDCLSRLPLPDTVPESEPYELIFTVETLSAMPISCVEIKQQTDADENLRELKSYIRSGWPINCNNQILKVYKKFIPCLSIFKGCILYDNRVLIPPSLRGAVLQLFHEGHPGIVGMKSSLRSLVWYPGIDQDTEKVVKNCSVCQLSRSKPAQNNTVEWPKPKRPWSRIHIDHFSLFNKSCLIAVDAFSKYIECEVVKSTSGEDTIDALRAIFSRNGLCDTLISDNASNFTAEIFQNYLQSNGIKHMTPPPYFPKGNGQAEVGVKVIKGLLKKTCSNAPFTTRLQRALFYYRTVPHSATNMAPCVMLNNRKYITKKDRLNPKFYDFSENSESKLISKFNIGEKVLVLNLRDGSKWLEGTVVQARGVNVYDVHIHSLDVVWKRHANQLLRISQTVQINQPVPQHLDNSKDHILPTGSSSLVEQSGSPTNYDIPVEQNVCPPVPHSESPIVSHEAAPSLRRSTRVSKPVVRYGFDD